VPNTGHKLFVAEPAWGLWVKLQLETHYSSQIASVKWNYSGSQSQLPDKWMLIIVNLTWTVDSLPYRQWIFIIDSRTCADKVKACVLTSLMGSAVMYVAVFQKGCIEFLQ